MATKNPHEIERLRRRNALIASVTLANIAERDTTETLDAVNAKCDALTAQLQEADAECTALKVDNTSLRAELARTKNQPIDVTGEVL